VTPARRGRAEARDPAQSNRQPHGRGGRQTGAANEKPPRSGGSRSIQ